MVEPNYFEIIKEIRDRWNLNVATVARIYRRPAHQEIAVTLLGISLGLAELFGDDRKAERDWMNEPHPNVGNVTPIGFILDDDEKMLARAKQVLAVIDDARGLR